MGVYPFGGVYDPIGYARRNGLLEADPVNPLPENAMKANTGNAGLDGYSVLSRADRFTRERPIATAEPFPEVPLGIPEESGT